VSWRITVWRGDLDADDETWEPLDETGAGEILSRVGGIKREGPDAWTWEGERGIFAQITLYSPADDAPVNDITTLVTFEPGHENGKRSDLRVLGDALFEIASRTGGGVGIPRERLFTDVHDFVEAGISADPWLRREQRTPAKSHVTRRELFGRLLRRD